MRGVERPNHSLRSAMRKAMLCPHALREFRDHWGATNTATASGLTQADFELGEDAAPTALALQLAMLFEKCCRSSDVGHDDDPDAFERCHAASCVAFAGHAKVLFTPHVFGAVLEALDRTCETPKTEQSMPAKACHGLDLFRRHSEAKMRVKLDEVARLATTAASTKLTALAEAAVAATGDRLTSSGTGATNAPRGCVLELFPRCSKDAAACWSVLQASSAPRDLEALFETTTQKIIHARRFNDFTHVAGMRNPIVGLFDDAANPEVSISEAVGRLPFAAELDELLRDAKKWAKTASIVAATAAVPGTTADPAARLAAHVRVPPPPRLHLSPPHTRPRRSRCHPPRATAHATAARSRVAGRMFNSKFCNGATAAAKHAISQPSAAACSAAPKPQNARGQPRRHAPPREEGVEGWPDRDTAGNSTRVAAPCLHVLACVLCTVLLATRPK